VGFEPTTSAQGNFSISLSLLNVLRKLRSQKYAGRIQSIVEQYKEMQKEVKKIA
jgi:hypothetical protein